MPMSAVMWTFNCSAKIPGNTGSSLLGRKKNPTPGPQTLNPKRKPYGAFGGLAFHDQARGPCCELGACTRSTGLPVSGLSQ